MQVSELVKVTSVPLATVKYYLREGLLPPGRPVTARSSEYGAEHVQRLTLLRLLREVGAIPVNRLRQLVDAVDDTGLTVHEMFGRASDAIAASGRRDDDASPVDDPEAAELVDRVVQRIGWDRLRKGSVDLDNLRRVVTRLRRTGLFGLDEDGLLFYARIADEIGKSEIAALPDDDDRAAQLERMVVGTVAFGEILTVMRRLAEEQHSAQRFDRPSGARVSR
jgi:DNA-binding transcriptional MerR regulator